MGKTSKNPLEIINEKYPLTPIENTNLLSVKGVNPLHILALLRKHGFRSKGSYQSKKQQSE